MHRKYLLQLKRQPARIFERDRNVIISTLQRDINHAYWCCTVTKKEVEELREKVKKDLSLDSLLGIKQLSIFDFLQDSDLQEHNKVVEHEEIH